MVVQVEEADTRRGHCLCGALYVGSGNSEHTSVVKRICVHVEQAPTRSEGDRLDTRSTPALAYMDNALEGRDFSGPQDLVCRAQLLSASGR